MTSFQRINQSAASSLWALFIPEACQGLLGWAGCWPDSRAPWDQSAVSLSESPLARSPQPPCASSTWEVLVKMHVSRSRLSRTESPFLGPGPGICCFLKLPE